MGHLKNLIIILLGCALSTNGFSAIAGYYSGVKPKNNPEKTCLPGQPNCSK